MLLWLFYVTISLIMSMFDDIRLAKNKYNNWVRYDRGTKATIVGGFAVASLFGFLSLYTYEQEANPRTMANDVAYISKGQPNQHQSEIINESLRKVNYLQDNAERALEIGAVAMAIGAAALAYGETKRLTS